MHTKYVLSTEYKGKFPLLSHGQKKQVNTLDDGDSDSEVMFIGAVNVEDKDWVETLIFGSIQGVFKLDNKAQCNILPKVAYDKLQQNLCNHPRQDMKVARKLVLDLLQSVSCFAGRVGKVSSITYFQVVDENYMPLLCRSSSENVGLIQRIKAVESDSILDEVEMRWNLIHDWGLFCSVPKITILD